MLECMVSSDAIETQGFLYDTDDTLGELLKHNRSLPKTKKNFKKTCQSICWAEKKVPKKSHPKKKHLKILKKSRFSSIKPVEGPHNVPLVPKRLRKTCAAKLDLLGPEISCVRSGGKF